MLSVLRRASSDLFHFLIMLSMAGTGVFRIHHRLATETDGVYGQGIVVGGRYTNKELI